MRPVRTPLLAALLAAFLVLAPAASGLEPGDLVVVDALGPSVFAVDPATGAQEVLSSGGLLGEPLGLELDPRLGILVADPGAGAVLRIDPRLPGTQQTLCELANPNDVALTAGGEILVAAGTTVVRCSDLAILYDAGADLRAIVVESAGTLLILERRPPFARITRLESDGTFRETLPRGNLLTAAQDMELLPSGDLLVADRGVPANGIVRVDSVTGAQERFCPEDISVETPFEDPVGVATDGNVVYLVDRNAPDGNGGAFRAGPLCGEQISSAGSFLSPRDVELAFDGDSDGRADILDNCPFTANADQADGDADGRGDVCDNCTVVPNSTQIDTDLDGFGNACDPDYTGDGKVGIADFGVLRAQYGRTCDDPAFDQRVDADDDCVIGMADFQRFRALFGGPPGPSGVGQPQ